MLTSRIPRYLDDDYKTGYTVLTAAADRGDAAVASALVEPGLGADPNKPDGNGYLPLVLAFKAESDGCAQVGLATVCLPRRPFPGARRL